MLAAVGFNLSWIYLTAHLRLVHDSKSLPKVAVPEQAIDSGAHDQPIASYFRLCTPRAVLVQVIKVIPVAASRTCRNRVAVPQDIHLLHFPAHGHMFPFSSKLQFLLLQRYQTLCISFLSFME